MIEYLLVPLSLLLLFFVPGASIILAIFGSYRNLSKEYPALYFILLSIAASVAVTVFVGTFLGSAGVYSQVLEFNSYDVVISLLLITLASLIVWYIRGYSRATSIEDLADLDNFKTMESYELQIEKLKGMLSEETNKRKKALLESKIKELNKTIEKKDREIEQRLF